MKRVLLWGLVVPALLRALTPRWLLESPLLVAARHPWRTLLAAGGAAAIGGLAVAASGVMPIAASAGHWTITEAFLQFAKRQAVRTHAFAIEPPPLDDPALVLRGAGHYESGCRPCHGVGGEHPRVPAAMLPAPPALEARGPTWRPAELFYIVKHGLKFTGMPAWPSQQRDDEVWAVVAFLQRLPQMEAGEYGRLVHGDAPAVAAAAPPAVPADPERLVMERCARCHGADGQGRGNAAFPRLGGQRADYLRRALDAYARGARHSGIMAPIAADLTAAMRASVAEYYARQPAQAGGVLASRAGEAADGRRSRGERIAQTGIPEQKIPACRSCHVTGDALVDPAYPRLDGQHAEYLVQQLRLLQDRHRGGSEYVHLMHNFVDRLSESQSADVAAYFAAGGR